MKLFTGALFAVLLLASYAEACTFTWDAVTKMTDGTPAVAVKYKLYYTPAGQSSPQVIADTDQATFTALCPAGKYRVSAYSATAAESAMSDPVTLQQHEKPANLLWTK